MLNFIKRHKRIICLASFSFVLLGFFYSRPLTHMVLNFYDTFITPYNGECAYRVLNGGDSCSTYFKDVLDNKGLFMAILAMPEQFHKCKLAAHELERRSDIPCMTISCGTPQCASVWIKPARAEPNPNTNIQCQEQINKLQSVIK